MDGAARDPSQAMGMKSAECGFSAPSPGGERENSGDDSIAAISISGTESLMPSNLPL